MPGWSPVPVILAQLVVAPTGTDTARLGTQSSVMYLVLDSPNTDPRTLLQPAVQSAVAAVAQQQPACLPSLAPYCLAAASGSGAAPVAMQAPLPPKRSYIAVLRASGAGLARPEGVELPQAKTGKPVKKTLGRNGFPFFGPGRPKPPPAKNRKTNPR